MELNRCLFIGNLTRDPDSRTTSTGKVVTNFSIAVNSRRGQQSGPSDSQNKSNEDVLFLKVETWGRTAEIASQYLKKGSQVLVDGRLKMEEYTTREGEKRRDPVIVADNIQLGARPRDDDGGGSRRESQQREERAPRQERRAEHREEAPRDYDNADDGGTRDDLPF